MSLCVFELVSRVSLFLSSAQNKGKREREEKQNLNKLSNCKLSLSLSLSFIRLCRAKRLLSPRTFFSIHSALFLDRTCTLVHVLPVKIKSSLHFSSVLLPSPSSLPLFSSAMCLTTAPIGVCLCLRLTPLAVFLVTFARSFSSLKLKLKTSCTMSD